MDNVTPWRAGRLTKRGRLPSKEENGDQRKACRSILRLLQHRLHLSSRDRGDQAPAHMGIRCTAEAESGG